MKWKEIEKLSASRFQRLVGVKRPTFAKMVEVLLANLDGRPTRQGRLALLCVEDQLLVMLMYYREYRTFFHIGVSFGISEAQCWRTVRRMEEQLIASRLFHLPGRKRLVGGDMGWEVVVVDVGEPPIERPKKNSGILLRQEKTAHAEDAAVGGQVSRESGVRIDTRTGILADSGYQGIQHTHPNCTKPIKGSKKRPLTKGDRQHNHAVGSQRVMV